MKKQLAIVVATFFVMGWAHGAQTNNGCQGNCPTEGGGGNAAATGGNGYGIGIGMGGQGGSGGNGGSGGAGGNASATGQGGQGGIGIGGAGGAVVGSGNSANSNLNSQGQSQGQGQSQSNKQGQSQSSSNSQSSQNDNRSNAANTNSNANNGNNSAQSLTVEGDHTTYQAARIPVATAYASGLTASNGTCMGSVSAGGQGMSFGFSVGTTWKDSGCDRRYNAQALAAVGQAKAAVALLCQDADIRAAMETAGTPCSTTKAEAKAIATQQAESVAIAKSEPVDPIIRGRLGLPPLK